MENPKSNMNQIAQVIAKDQALASKTIKLVNSAFYGMSKKVTSISQAIIILGLNTVNNLMMAISVVKMFTNTGEKPIFNQEEFWEHSFATALIARLIAKKIYYDDPEVCFISGLIHDIGRLVYDQFLHNDFLKAYTLSKEKNVALIQLEEAILGGDHTFAGGYLSTKWKLPPEIYSSIRFHHSVFEVPQDYSQHSKVITIVAKANQIANKEGIGSSGDNYITPDNSIPPLKIDQREIDSIVESVKSEIKSTIREWHK
jgi:HD-like signal output (HDOD) protein